MWAAPVFQIGADGKTSVAPGPVEAEKVIADGLNLGPVANFANYIKGVGQTFGLVGSSTAEHCSIPSIHAAAGFREIDDGPWACAKARYGMALNLVYNGGVGSTLSPAILASMDTMIAAKPNLDWHWILLGSNDMQNGSITAQVCFDTYTVPAVRKSFAAGAKACIVIPHTTATASLARISNVIEYRRLCQQLVERYPGRVCLWDHFKYCSEPYGGVTPARLLDQPEGVHLSPEGAWVAGLGGDEIAKLVPRIPVADPWLFGTPLNSDPECDTPADYTMVNGTAELGPADKYGRSAIDFTLTTGGQIMYARATASMTTGKKYRMFGDLEALTDNVTSMSLQARGTNTGEVIAQIGGETWGGNPYVEYMPIGTRKQWVSSEFTIGALAGTRIYVLGQGGSGAKIRVRSFGVVEVPA